MSPWFVEHSTIHQTSLNHEFSISLVFLNGFSEGIYNIDCLSKASVAEGHPPVGKVVPELWRIERPDSSIYIQCKFNLYLNLCYCMRQSESKSRELKTTRLTCDCNSSCLCPLHFSELTYGQADAVEKCAAVFLERVGCCDSGPTATAALTLTFLGPHARVCNLFMNKSGNFYFIYFFGKLATLKETVSYAPP